MEKTKLFQITEEHFAECWAYIDKRRRAASIKAAIASMSGFLVNLFFLETLVFGAAGLIYEYVSSTFDSFWETSFFFPLWEMVCGYLQIQGGDLQSDIIRLLLAAYLVSAVLFCLLTLLVRLVYHPRKAPLPTGTYPENTDALAKLAQKGRDICYKTHLATSIVAVVFAIISIFVLLFSYIIYTEDAQLFFTLLSIFPTKDYQTNSIIYVLFLYMISSIFCTILLFITRPLYRYDFPYELVVQAQRSAILARENTDGLPAEELEARCRENAAKIREDALSLEKEKAYEKAKNMLLEAALLSDRDAMEHYARHCLLSRMNDSARYWLKKRISMGEPTPQAKKMYLRLILKLRHNVEYLKPEEAPATIGMKIKRILGIILSIILRILVVALLVVTILICVGLFKSGFDPNFFSTLPAQWEQLMGSFSFSQEDTNHTNLPTEEVSPFETPVISLTEEYTPWENKCVAYDETGAPVVFCYSKDRGGELYAPCGIGAEGTLDSAGLYSGDQLNIPSITQHVTYLPQTQTLVVAGEYLMSLEPGEYFIIINNDSYLPLLISETHTFNSTQRGLAARGNETGWIINDLENLQDITLSFYNLGDNPIRALTEIVPLSNTVKQTPMESQLYTISPDGSSVTISSNYWAQQEVGTYVGFRVHLANGDILDTGLTNVCTVEGDFTGLMEIIGEMTYSLCYSDYYSVQCQFALPGTLTHLTVSTDSQPNLIEDDLTGTYYDPESGTITLPADVLKPHLDVGDYFHVQISYTTAHGQNAYVNFSVLVGW